MSKSNEQLAQSINTTTEVVDYLMGEKKMSEEEIVKMISDDEPTDEMVKEIWENAIPEDEEYFFWGDVEYNR